ncbi:MAG: hypothetical protein GY829_06120, partial [Gammaproteobacteria bacterium]|nr:hypothetical protein [Gammaproteobacteria bacterium]
LKDAHINRITTDKEFRYLIDDINEYLEHNDDKSLSLNFDKRKAKRKEREDKVLTRENKRRLEKGLEIIASIDDIDEKDDKPDPRLNETAEILQDFIQLLDGQKIAFATQKEKVEQLEN